uniref:Uncharacterized protein MANES_06G142400 n=1 Tax=Rhizophora mucronata TaxID=61149 RepID=A0A2P2LWV3_RHIMU
MPTRHTLPPDLVAPSAVDMVLVKPAQSKATSTSVPIALCISNTSSATSSIFVETLTIWSAPRSLATDKR